MVILGLTGSIAMGKSVAAAMFGRLRIPVHDADAAVHRLLAEDRATIARIEWTFPDVTAGGRIDREVLARRVFGDSDALKALEDILHPAVLADQYAFLERAALAGKKVAVLDVPLLFETGMDRRCDLVAVVWAPAIVQEARLRARGRMSKGRLAAIRARQMREAEKKARADFLIPSGLGRRPTFRAVRQIAAAASRIPGRCWPWPDPRFEPGPRSAKPQGTC